MILGLGFGLLRIFQVGIFDRFSTKIIFNEQNCINQGDYCVYDNIPSELMKYSSFDLEMSEEDLISYDEFDSYIYFLQYSTENPKDFEYRCRETEEEPLLL